VSHLGPRARLSILGSWLAFLVVQNLLWVRRTVLPAPPPWDPALYLFLSLRYWHALTERGVAALWRELQDLSLSPYVPPLFPLSALPFYVLFGESRLAAYATSSVFLCLLLLGTYLLARWRHGEGAGLLALFLASTFSAPVNLSRDYQMDLPGAALLTLGVCCLRRSEGFRGRGWSLAFGGLAGLALLTKTMSGPFFVPPALAALVRSWRERADRRRVLLNLGIALAAAALLASLWWGAHFERAVWYLLYFGWGAGADPYAPAGAESVFALPSLTFYLVALANQGASVPCFLLMLGLLAHGAWQRWRGRASRSRDRPPEDGGTALWTWLLAGYVLLSLSRNKTADRYVIFLVPPLAALLAGAIATLPRAGWRRCVTAAALLAGLANYAALTWPEAGPPLLSWRPPFTLVSYRPRQTWLRMEPGVHEGDWQLPRIVTALSDSRAATKARLLTALLAEGLPDTSAPEEQVRTAYRWTLRREPDPEGLGAYARELRDGVKSPAQLLRSLAASDEFAARPLRVLVVPDHPFLNSSTLRYHAEAARAPLLFARVDPGHVGPWPLRDYDALLVKDGGYQGPAFSTTHIPWIEAELRGGRTGFERHPASFPCPDESRVLLFVFAGTGGA